MGLFEGKTSTERNKILAAGALGLVALFALYMAFGRSFFRGSATTATTKISPTPKPGASPGAIKNDRILPTADEQRFQYETTPVVYNANNAYAPDPGRNIFAFYEPPPPTPYIYIEPTPVPIVVIPPSPTPTPVFVLGYINPQMVFAGSRGFKLEVSGDRFTPDSRIYFNQAELQTTFVSPQRLTADILPNMIAQAGPRQIIVQTPDGIAYSSQILFSVQAPPTPSSFQYIGMIGRTRYNNDTAYLIEAGKPTPIGVRLSDVVGGRFRLVDISAAEVVFEDVTLGFKHRLPMTTTPTTGGAPGRADGFAPFNPNSIPQGNIPGIPNNIPRTVPPNQQPKPADKKEDVDDNDVPPLK